MFANILDSNKYSRIISKTQEPGIGFEQTLLVQILFCLSNPCSNYFLSAEHFVSRITLATHKKRSYDLKML